MESLRAELERTLALENPTERMLGVAALVGEVVSDLGFQPVVVGGLAVQFWTQGAYSTGDIDVLLPHGPAVDDRLALLGFRREGRHWVLPGHDLFLEAPASFLGPNEQADEVRLPGGRSVWLLSVEDVLIYRLHEFVGTGHREVASQAVALLGVPEVERERLMERARQEDLVGALEAVELLASRIDAGETIQSHELHAIARNLRTRG